MRTTLVFFVIFVITLLYKAQTRSIIYNKIVRCIDPPSTFPQNPYSPNAFPSNAFPSNAFPSNAFPSNVYSPNAYPSNVYSPNAFPSNVYSPNAYSPINIPGFSDNIPQYSINNHSIQQPSTNSSVTNVATVTSNSTQQGSVCRAWSEKTNIHYASSGYCFPSGTKVATPDGPTDIGRLRVGDSVMAWDPADNRNKYTQVIGWLERDPFSTQQFLTLRTDHNQSYTMSPQHNIALIREGEMLFTFAEHAHKGDQLYTLGNNAVTWVSSEEQEREGLYAPYTSTGTFYIYGEGSGSDLLLVHCLARVSEPMTQNTLAYYVVTIVNLFYGAQPKDDEEYTHTLLTHQHLFFRNALAQARDSHKYYSSSSSTHQQQQYINQVQMVALAQMLMISTQMWTL